MTQLRNPSSIALLMTLLSMGTALSAGTAAAQATAAEPDACSDTAEAVRTACGHDVLDKYNVQVGGCLNIADATDRNKCLADARTTRDEDSALCGDQFTAREAVCRAVGEAPYDPEFKASDFVNPLEIGKSVQANRFFPLNPGARWVYRSQNQVNTVEVLGKVQKVLGVPCTMVHDLVMEGGQVIEDTLDLFGQTVEGAVWYCGETSETFEDRQLVSLEGTWQAGRDLGRPGIIMEAAPKVGDFYRQEFKLAVAEDVARVISVTGSANVPATSCDGTCVVTNEFTPIEPDVSERKFYAPGIGVILEVESTGERSQLVEFRIP